MSSLRVFPGCSTYGSGLVARFLGGCGRSVCGVHADFTAAKCVRCQGARGGRGAAVFSSRMFLRLSRRVLRRVRHFM